MCQIARLAVALVETRKYPSDLRVALGGDDRHLGAMPLTVEREPLRFCRMEVTLRHRLAEFRRNVAPCILDEGNQIVTSRAGDGVLKIDHAHARRPAPLREPDEILGVIVAVHEYRWD